MEKLFPQATNFEELKEYMKSMPTMMCLECRNEVHYTLKEIDYERVIKGITVKCKNAVMICDKCGNEDSFNVIDYNLARINDEMEILGIVTKNND